MTPALRSLMLNGALASASSALCALSRLTATFAGLMNAARGRRMTGSAVTRFKRRQAAVHATAASTPWLRRWPASRCTRAPAPRQRVGATASEWREHVGELQRRVVGQAGNRRPAGDGQQRPRWGAVGRRSVARVSRRIDGEA